LYTYDLAFVKYEIVDLLCTASGGVCPLILEAQHRVGGRIHTLRGPFALFDPGQQTLLHDEIVKPEGRIHFAWEHASLYHAWIQGAFESGLRVAIAIHQSL